MRVSRLSFFHGRYVHRLALIAGLSCALAGVSSRAAVAADATAGPNAAVPGVNSSDVPRIKVGSIRIEYAKPHAGLPSASAIAERFVSLRQAGGGLVATQARGELKLVQLADLANGQPLLSVSAVKDLEKQIQEYINSSGVVGIFIYPKGLDLDNLPDDAATKPQDIQFVIIVGVIKQVRTVNHSTHDKDALAGIDLPADARIRQNSPVQATAGQDLIDKDAIDDYLSVVNRQPGRHVETALSSAGSGAAQEDQAANDDQVVVDYLITDSTKPIDLFGKRLFDFPGYVYVQGQNSGTRQTSDWRETFGLVDNQLTHNDDILSVSYDTASFGDSYDINASYDLPLSSDGQIRLKTYATYDRFVASDIGQDNSGINLVGQGTTIGTELSWNFYHHHQLFVDALLGIRYDNFGVVSSEAAPGTRGYAEFLVPSVGLRVSRDRINDATHFQVNLEANTGRSFYDNHNQDNLGRPDTAANFEILKGYLNESFYLEPLFASGFSDPSTANVQAANEVFGSIRGQEAFGHRLIAEYQQVTGGLNSVRGYDESLIAGDNVAIASLEYRFHVARALGIGKPGTFLGTQTGLLGNDFHYQPEYTNGATDWDLVPCAFVDGALVQDSHGVADGDTFNEKYLLSTGIGVNFRLKQNLIITTDYGWVLNPVDAGNVHVSRGDGQWNLSVTLLY